MGKQPDWAIRIGAWFLENGHRVVLALTGGRYPKKVLGMQPVELYTVGSKSGQRRGTLLTAPIYEADRVVLVASYGGGTDNPAWYKNLVKNPAVEIAVDEVTRAYTAHTASPDEKAALWPTITKVNPGYAGYQKNTDREIPVIICTPA
ncbi:nitroreductase/quinone reductase family protein [Mycobacteroides sp. LB1]|uniref:nitroreductase/quinone reductase family protein n=1 Tax=Mycobacteroides sp. LB1 TaxID=2750814 RepID=UPI0015DFB224|nr:nitroreductase family deazaflavin-dependent oxidoreductase [Mycobacteroides sp. LB1]